jgi:Fe-S-cluster-containing dehydrogenase component
MSEKKKNNQEQQAESRGWYLVVDVALCEDCNNCFLACKDEHVDNDWPGYTMSQPRHGHRWMNIGRTERGQYPIIDVAYRPTPCQHCDNPPCRDKAENGAIVKRNDGVVLIDPQKAVGQKALVSSCPYGAIFWNEEKNLPQKCTFCAHLLDSGWAKPRCAQACPTGALTAHHLTEAEYRAMAADKTLETLHPHLETAPRVLYRNLHRFDKCFIAGSVAYNKNGQEECAQGIKAVLSGSDGQVVGETTTDAFGDFKLDGIPPDSGSFSVLFSGDGFKDLTLDVEVTKSVYVGVLTMETA